MKFIQVNSYNWENFLSFEYPHSDILTKTMVGWHNDRRQSDRL